MTDELIKMLEQRVGRRGFLRGSGLAAAAVVGAAASAAKLSAQDQKNQTPTQNQKRDDDQKRDGQSDKDQNGKQDATAEDPYKVTRIDDKGREYRLCPVCGSNMYRQDHTWTCENCGYSYEE